MNTSRFAGKTAIVTGAGSGIGFAIAELMSSQGAQVLAVDRDTAGLARLGADIDTVTADVTDPALPDTLRQKLEGRPLSILVNNAGIGGGGRADETGEENFRRYFEINVLALFSLSKFAVSAMRQSGGGTIVNIASIYAIVGATGSAGYSTSKAAVDGLTRQMATDFGPENIRVNAVAPGLIETPLTAERIRREAWRRHIFVEQAPLRRVGLPGDVAQAVAFLASDEAAFITGATLRVDGGWAVGRYPRQGDAA
ncbi:SDR family oxidoreductase [Nitratireductor sp. L1-7-SE]|uniref:SDR family oxidoreductase n=1 Tax=Nitratireductor rhodophyticola TaxID=2854036 RepID=A0ABS7R613_9HYPH|nr:SDR family oxidoreductase [Nitratireductor rhodophyticola]MBY8916351.1 SDR family oxidoreductase [Nitratireductor rhodophyticola]MBY8921714.1 SDR family oxidoreductase [Nitratireductor rhodophyticola]